MPSASDLNRLMDQIDPMREGGALQKALERSLYGPETAAEKLNAMLLGDQSDLKKAWEKLVGRPEIPPTAWGLVDFTSARASEELQKLADAIFSASKNPFASLTRELVKEGIDADDLHTEGFLALLSAMKAQAPEDQIDYAEPLVRLLIAYDILLVVERELKAFVAATMQEAFGDNWIDHTPKQFQKDLQHHRGKRERHSAVNHDLFSYASLTELEAIFKKESLWQTAFDPALDHSQEWFIELLREITSIRSDVAHPKVISDDDFGWFVLAARWMLSAISYLPSAETAASQDT